jgi:hypothetical protein
VNTGRTFQYSGKAAAGGKQYFTRVTETFAEDFLTFNQKGEFSVDSKTWTPWFEANFTKSTPIPKK